MYYVPNRHKINRAASYRRVYLDFIWLLQIFPMECSCCPNMQPFRMRTGTGAGGSDETPVRRSARQAGMDPPPPQSPLPDQPAAEPTLSQMLMMMDERHRISMAQIMREFGAHVQNN